MKTFDVYKHPIHGLQAVKRGFGWPAFLFTVIWAFVKKMWELGAALLAAFIILAIIETFYEPKGYSVGALIILLAQLSIYIIVGIKGNEWRGNHLLKRGFEHIQTVQAESPDAAIGATAKPKKDPGKPT